jgi:cytosine/adenosine deaminase-related metal-dependent hydrolase
METFSLRARWVLTMEGPPLEGGLVEIADGRIVGVGPAGRGSVGSGGNVVDLGDVVLMPGLVNAHAHLEFSDLTAPLGSPGTPLPQWIAEVIALRKRGDRDASAAIRRGRAESLAAGVTTIGEIATAPIGCYDEDPLASQCVLLLEAIGFSAQRVDSVAADVERRLSASGAWPAGVSPHAPYSTHPRLVAKLAALAAASGTPLAMHLAESREELEFLRTGGGPFRDLLEARSMWDPQAIPPGSRPRDYLQVLADSGCPRAIVVHGNYLASDEIALVGRLRERMSVAFCPRTHAHFGHDAYPLDAMLAAGVRVVLGTDSRASNPDLDLLAEVRFAARRFPQVAPERWLRMATLDTAYALGLETSTGSLAAGKRADLTVVPVASTDREPCEAIVRGSARPVATWLRGVKAG